MTRTDPDTMELLSQISLSPRPLSVANQVLLTSPLTGFNTNQLQSVPGMIEPTLPQQTPRLNLQPKPQARQSKMKPSAPLFIPNKSRLQLNCVGCPLSPPTMNKDHSKGDASTGSDLHISQISPDRDACSTPFETQQPSKMEKPTTKVYTISYTPPAVSIFVHSDTTPNEIATFEKTLTDEGIKFRKDTPLNKHTLFCFENCIAFETARLIQNKLPSIKFMDVKQDHFGNRIAFKVKRNTDGKPQNFKSSKRMNDLENNLIVKFEEAHRHLAANTRDRVILTVRPTLVWELIFQRAKAAYGFPTENYFDFEGLEVFVTDFQLLEADSQSLQSVKVLNPKAQIFVPKPKVQQPNSWEFATLPSTITFIQPTNVNSVTKTVLPSEHHWPPAMSDGPSETENPEPSHPQLIATGSSSDAIDDHNSQNTFSTFSTFSSRTPSGEQFKRLKTDYTVSKYIIHTKRASPIKCIAHPRLTSFYERQTTIDNEPRNDITNVTQNPLQSFPGMLEPMTIDFPYLEKNTFIPFSTPSHCLNPPVPSFFPKQYQLQSTFVGFPLPPPPMTMDQLNGDSDTGADLHVSLFSQTRSTITGHDTPKHVITLASVLPEDSLNLFLTTRIDPFGRDDLVLYDKLSRKCVIKSRPPSTISLSDHSDTTPNEIASIEKALTDEGIKFTRWTPLNQRTLFCFEDCNTFERFRTIQSQLPSIQFMDVQQDQFRNRIAFKVKRIEGPKPQDFKSQKRMRKLRNDLTIKLKEGKNTRDRVILTVRPTLVWEQIFQRAKADYGLEVSVTDFQLLEVDSQSKQSVQVLNPKAPDFVPKPKDLFSNSPQIRTHLSSERPWPPTMSDGPSTTVLSSEHPWPPAMSDCHPEKHAKIILQESVDNGNTSDDEDELNSQKIDHNSRQAFSSPTRHPESTRCELTPPPNDLQELSLHTNRTPKMYPIPKREINIQLGPSKEESERPQKFHYTSQSKVHTKRVDVAPRCLFYPDSKRFIVELGGFHLTPSIMSDGHIKGKTNTLIEEPFERDNPEIYGNRQYLENFTFNNDDGFSQRNDQNSVQTAVMAPSVNYDRAIYQNQQDYSDVTSDYFYDGFSQLPSQDSIQPFHQQTTPPISRTKSQNDLSSTTPSHIPKSTKSVSVLFSNANPMDTGQDPFMIEDYVQLEVDPDMDKGKSTYSLSIDTDNFDKIKDDSYSMMSFPTSGSSFIRQ
ncbi:hypothetical protein BLNAU_11443 [Blattamonas nauphoetae]|uniref:Uncharacterized protein n=1 Tax=Blattamonas nauphoetae TaxID=2049346 RepID=A0ABQ9XPX5_9EUKA|nr:hypothetical protein BLNAU_11443 [Blattamonas nauphoetae]